MHAVERRDVAPMASEDLSFTNLFPFFCRLMLPIERHGDCDRTSHRSQEREPRSRLPPGALEDLHCRPCHEDVAGGRPLEFQCPARHLRHDLPSRPPGEHT